MHISKNFLKSSKRTAENTIILHSVVPVWHTSIVETNLPSITWIASMAYFSFCKKELRTSRRYSVVAQILYTFARTPSS